MPQVLRNTLLSARDLLVTAGPFVLIAALLLLLAYVVLDPNPPNRVVLATGADQGAYAEFGKRYAAALRRHGIEVVLRGTQGAAENLQLLRDPAAGVDLAFVQGGADLEHASQSDADAANAGLVSLGSLFYEPVWLFYREESAQRRLGRPTLESLTDMSRAAGPLPRPGEAPPGGGRAAAGDTHQPDWKLNIGAPGSGVPNLMKRLLDANRIDPAALTLVQQASTPAVVALLAGEIDALAFASAPESPLVQMLLQTPGIRLFDFPQAEAYSRRFPFISAVTLPRGVVDLARDMPPANIRMIAPTATLVARETMHPALVQLFVQSARTIHGGAGWFQRKGAFPSIENTERPLAPEAERFYRNGPPLLQRYLPFWIANLVDRMWVVLVSIVAILIPLSRVVPPLYQFRIRSRIFRWYGQLRRIEESIGERSGADLLQQLDELEDRAGRVTVPLSYADELYSLRSHIGMVRRRLRDVVAA